MGSCNLEPQRNVNTEKSNELFKLNPEDLRHKQFGEVIIQKYSLNVRLFRIQVFLI